MITSKSNNGRYRQSKKSILPSGSIEYYLKLKGFLDLLEVLEIDSDSEDLINYELVKVFNCNVSYHYDEDLGLVQMIFSRKGPANDEDCWKFLEIYAIDNSRR